MAEAAFRRSIELDPKQTQAYRELVYLYALECRKAECDAQFRALVRLTTFDYVLAFAWGQNDCEIWDPNEAITVLRAIVANDPADRFSRLALATNYRLINDFLQAEATLEPLSDTDFDVAARFVSRSPSTASTSMPPPGSSRTDQPTTHDSIPCAVASRCRPAIPRGLRVFPSRPRK